MDSIITLSKLFFTITALCFIGGILVSILFLIFGTLAIPVYNAFRFFELLGFLKLKFNLPKNGCKRKIADFAAGFCTLSLLELLRLYIQKHGFPTVYPSPVLNLQAGLEGFIAFMMDTNNIPSYFAILNLLCIVTLLVISRLTSDEDNDKMWFDKLLPLKLPKF